MELPQEAEAEEEFKRVKVFGRLITNENPQFDQLFGDTMQKVPVERGEIVMPVFDIVFEDFHLVPPTPIVEEMIEDEIDESIMGNHKIAHQISKISPEEVLEAPPVGFPTTEDALVADFAVTPDQKGLIAHVSLEEIVETV